MKLIEFSQNVAEAAIGGNSEKLPFLSINAEGLSESLKIEIGSVTYGLNSI